MLMPLRDLRAIYEVLFRDGVMVAKKDKRPQIMHPEVQGVSNLQVMRAMLSLKSRGYVKETFAWRHFYWYLTNDGIVYLRDYLRLPVEIVPASLQRIRKPAASLAIAHRPRLLPEGTGGVVLLGAFLHFAPVNPSSWHWFMFCGCFLASLFSLSRVRDKHSPCKPLCSGMRRIWEVCR
uniref:Plectin/eS10 N-terminal domain-containing protein n=1 Tax=Amphiprion percula TaxID=161767 RepID=A0A3P8TWT5_AMPPE